MTGVGSRLNKSLHYLKNIIWATSHPVGTNHKWHCGPCNIVGRDCGYTEIVDLVRVSIVMLMIVDLVELWVLSKLRSYGAGSGLIGWGCHTQ